jgi:radical SAM-linked protein
MAELPERLRLRYTKTGRIRYTSQRDVARAWERALRRAHLPVAYSEGFSPRPLLSFSLALPTGCESLAEYCDVRFATAQLGEGRDRIEEVAQELSGLLPEGLEVVAATPLEGSEASLQEAVTLCSWIVEVTGMSTAAVVDRVEHLLSAAQVLIERERKGRRVSDDLRPSILALNVEGSGARTGAVRLSAELATKPRGVRPGELLSALDPGLRLAYACRQAQFTEFESRRVEPLDRDGRSAAQQMAAMVSP